MDKTRKNELIEKLGQEIKKAKGLAQKRETAAKRAKTFSRSQQGDRRYFEDADRLSQESLANLLVLKDEILASSNKPATEVKPVAFVTLEHQGGDTSSFFFVSRAASIPGVQLLTPDSPLGKAIAGKKEGEKFSYQIEKEGQTTTYSGRIQKIE